jgi:hypothetical protein
MTPIAARTALAPLAAFTAARSHLAAGTGLALGTVLLTTLTQHALRHPLALAALALGTSLLIAVTPAEPALLHAGAIAGCENADTIQVGWLTAPGTLEDEVPASITLYTPTRAIAAPLLAFQRNEDDPDGNRWEVSYGACLDPRARLSDQGR